MVKAKVCEKGIGQCEPETFGMLQLRVLALQKSRLRRSHNRFKTRLRGP